MPTVTEILETMDYGPAPEANDIVVKWLNDRKVFGHYIDGTLTAPGRTFAAKNPATGETLAEVTQGTAADVAAAVRAARTALPGWSRLPGHERAKWLYAIARYKVVDAFRARGGKVEVPIEDFDEILAAEAGPDACCLPRAARVERAQQDIGD